MEPQALLARLALRQRLIELPACASASHFDKQLFTFCKAVYLYLRPFWLLIYACNMAQRPNRDRHNRQLQTTAALLALARWLTN